MRSGLLISELERALELVAADEWTTMMSGGNCLASPKSHRNRERVRGAFHRDQLQDLHPHEDAARPRRGPYFRERRHTDERKRLENLGVVGH
jgi:hypothetical protein